MKIMFIKLLKQKYAKHCLDCEWTLVYFHSIVVKWNVHVLGYIFLTNSHSLLFWGTLWCKICWKADDSIAGMLVTNVGVLFFFKCPIMSPISHRSGWSVTQWGQIVYQIACLKMRKWIRLKLILNWINLALKQETGAREIVGHNNSNKTTTSNGLYPIVHAMAYHWNFTTKGKLTIELHLKLYEINWDERRKNKNKTTNFLHVLEL